MGESFERIESGDGGRCACGDWCPVVCVFCVLTSAVSCVKGADREFRKSEDATHFATDGPAPRRYDRCTARTSAVQRSLSGVKSPTRSSVTVSSNLRRARRTSTAPSMACSSLRLKLGEQLLCCSHALASSISLWHSSRYKTLILTIARKMYLSVPSRGSCDPAE